MRNASILGLVLLAALLPILALPLAIVFVVESILVVIAPVVLGAACDAQPVPPLARTLLRAPPSR